MTITIDWGTKVISIPKVDMTQIQSVPIEIRELNAVTFHTTLRELEESEEGMAFPDTHMYTSPTSIGGADLVAVVELINDYTVTFEDGQYAVNLTGGNNNIGDKMNLNQVSVRSSNSAGYVIVPVGSGLSDAQNDAIFEIKDNTVDIETKVDTVDGKVDTVDAVADSIEGKVDDLALDMAVIDGNVDTIFDRVKEILQGSVGTVDIVDNGNGTETVNIFDVGSIDPDNDTPIFTMTVSNQGARRIRN